MYPMSNRSEILKTVKSLLAEMFELDETDIDESSDMYSDLDIDSIDAVDLIVKLKEITGKSVAPEDFKEVRSVGDVINVVEMMLKD